MMALGSSTKALFAGAGVAFGTAALAGTVKDAIAVKIEYDKINNVLKAVTGSSKDAAVEFGFLSSESERLGLQLRPLAQTYTRLAASAKLLGISTEESREIFTSFSEALTGFGASREQSIRVFAAIEQILSKGKVSAEELRQQLGEALPGSLQLAANALGVTTQELDGMLKRGEVLSKDFILPFARAVRNEFGGAAVEGAKLLNAEFNRTINVLDKVKLAFVEGTVGGNSLADSVARILKNMREFLSDEDRLKRIAEFGTTLGIGLEVAAKSLQNIATILSKIPNEVLLAAGLLAVGKSLKTTSAVSSNLATIALGGARTSGGAGTRAGGRPFTNLEGVSSRLGGFSSIGALALQESILKQGRTTIPEYSFDRLGNQIGESESIRKERAKTVSGLRKFGSALTSGTKGLVNLVGTLPIVSAGLAGWASVFNFYAKAASKKATFEEKSRKADLEGAAAVAFSQIKTRTLAGEVLTRKQEDDILTSVLESKGAYKAPSQGGASLKELDKVRAEFEGFFETVGKVAERVREVIDPTKAVVATFTGETAGIKEYMENVKTLGKVRADEIQSVKELQKNLEAQNVVAKEAKKIAQERVSAESQKARQDISRSFEQQTADIQREIQVRKELKGVSEAEINRVIQLNQAYENLRRGGLSPEEAEELARSRSEAQETLRKATEKRELGQAGAVGVATKARSVDAALRRQKGVEERRFNQNIEIMRKIANSLQNLEENSDNFSIGIA
jgi:tape measure domain-containing protein